MDKREIPCYEKQELYPKKNDYCICVFVINEGEKIQKQLKVMSSYTQLVDVIIADGGSSDNSLAIAFLKEQKVTTLLTKKDSGKLSAQMRMALAYALDKEYKGVIVVDGNGKDDMRSIPFFLEALKQGYDHVQGSRFIPGGKAINTPLSRLLALKLIHAPLISLAARVRYTDTTNGFRAYSRKLIEHPDVQPFRNIFNAYELHYYLAIRAAQLGLKIKEVAVTRTYPKTGKIPTKISPFKGNLLILKTLFKAILNRYNP
jgi:glycosyltransferase involved in cell wall biosynthesis